MTTGDLISRFRAIRTATDALCAPLSAEDCQVQSMDDASPVKWHLAHTSWFFETFVLDRVRDYPLFHPQFRNLFNSYYQTVGPQHPRPQRGLLTRPGLDEVRAYRRHVDQHLVRWLSASPSEPELIRIVDLGLHHEQQHQELILTDVKHLLAQNPLRAGYAEPSGTLHETPLRALRWHAYEGGIKEIGHAGASFSFDNETPRHRVLLQPFQLASRLVTNAEVIDFIADGGYRRPELWLADGWTAVVSNGWSAPMYWEARDNDWVSFTLTGTRSIHPNEPACHLSFYEADAFARWAGARLPTEAEWEVAASTVEIAGNFLEGRRWHPQPASDTNAAAPGQLFGDAWEWTQSPYQPYPGYRPPAGALGEYNGKFMCNQLVLRGGSCVTPQSHMRPTYRNFFPPGARWQFSGLRLARDA